MNDEVKIRLVDDQMSCDLDGEAAILNLKSGIYFGLNPVGTRIWNLLKENPRTLGEIRETILGEYEVGFEQCDGDLRALVGQLKEHRLVETIG
jgi:hypothetical protein